ncbi:hypothetical protein PybrP1_012861 [[Pythium] brassicae (nom. inval.)]|nr:hypothetical protein PybrP1_012861 [[Pythium] brassicae (nom. inval.)]
MFFSFKDFLSAEDAARFFELTHAAQVAKVAAYLEFLGQQPVAAHFGASPRASSSFARKSSSRPRGQTAQDESSAAEPVLTEEDEFILQELINGRTRSGFGAFGTESGVLPQKELSLAVAEVCGEIGHEYVVERPRRSGEAPTLNSRSFFFYWCHAEKQKLVDIRRKLDRLHTHEHTERRRGLWQHIVIVVDRAMCPDCIAFAACLARSEQIFLAMEDPAWLRVFPPDAEQSAQLLPLHRATS